MQTPCVRAHNLELCSSIESPAIVEALNSLMVCRVLQAPGKVYASQLITLIVRKFHLSQTCVSPHV